MKVLTVCPEKGTDTSWNWLKWSIHNNLGSPFTLTWHHPRQPASRLPVPPKKWFFSNPLDRPHGHLDLLSLYVDDANTHLSHRWKSWKYSNLSVCKIKHLKSVPPVSLRLLMISPSPQSPKIGSSFRSLTIPLSSPKQASFKERHSPL